MLIWQRQKSACTGSILDVTQHQDSSECTGGDGGEDKKEELGFQ